MQWACLVLVPEELALGAQGFPLEEPVQEAQVFQLGERVALKQDIRELTLGEQAQGEQAQGEQKPGVLVLAELELGVLVQEAQVFQLEVRGALKQDTRELTLGEQALGEQALEEQKPGVLVLAELELGVLVQEAQVFQLGELGALKQNIQEPKPGELVEKTQVSQQEEQKAREW
jgi:hypothetical protein